MPHQASTTRVVEEPPASNSDLNYSERRSMEKEGSGRGTPHSEEYLRAHTIGELQPLSAPLIIVNYDPKWPRLFRDEADKIRSAIGERALRIEHVGSTSVPGLAAKPIIDIVLLVADSATEQNYAGVLEKAGFQLRIREPEWYEHRMFKGAQNSVNLHVFSKRLPRSRPDALVPGLVADESIRPRVICTM